MGKNKRVADYASSVRAVAYEAIEVADSAVGLTAETAADSTHAFMTVETAEIRFRFDGESPTATEGHIAAKGDVINLTNADDIANFKAIRTGSTSANIRVTYSK